MYLKLNSAYGCGNCREIREGFEIREEFDKYLSIKKYGTDYGGFYYPPKLDGLNKNSIIYCVGAGLDITHDISIAHQLGSKVYIFDPTPKAIDHINYVKDVFDGIKKPVNNKAYGGGDINYWDILLKNKIKSSNIVLEPYGLYTENNVLKFYKPSNTNFVSHSLDKNISNTDSYIEVPVKELKTIMKNLNHQTIDLLKIDIEGVECMVIDKMLKDNILPLYLSVDFDSIHKNKQECIRTINNLKKNGYSIISQNGQDYSFKKNFNS